ncbi:MAG: class I SAM-dependent methyltransferase [Nitrospinales bacterium]
MAETKIFFPADSPFLQQDPRKDRWAIPYNFECLNARVENLLWKQKDAVAGKRILDVACHMGTFACAALQMDAAFVQGVDVEEERLKQGRALFEQLRLPKDRYRLEPGEVPGFLETLKENSFDTIFCFGILYYLAEPLGVLRQMRRLARETILVDTFTTAYCALQGKEAPEILARIQDDALLDLPLMMTTATQARKKDYRLPHSFRRKNRELSLMTFPSAALLERWFEVLGMEYQRLDWSPYIVRPVHWRELAGPRQKKESHWADVYACGVRLSYRLFL